MSNACETALGLPSVQALFSEHGLVLAMLEFEAELARAQAQLGMIKPEHAAVIAACCQSTQWSETQCRELIASSAMAGSLAIPMLESLKARVAERDMAAVQAVHVGATSQDVIDTAVVLQTRRALQTMQADLGQAIQALENLIHAHGAVPVLARTLMQPASVVSFSHRCLSWLMPLRRCAEQLRQQAHEALRVQLGGAVGSQAALGPQAPALVQALSAHWDLQPGGGSWHTQRDAWVRLASECAVLCGALGKIGRDLALLSQAEVGEVLEGDAPGRGGSSAMPHKRNPVGAMVAIAAAQRAPHRMAAILSCMPQEQERSLGLWQAELAEWCGLMDLTAGALSAVAHTLPTLQIHQDRMALNLLAVPGMSAQQAQQLAAASHERVLKQIEPTSVKR